jgi:hypothetical protein
MFPLSSHSLSLSSSTFSLIFPAHYCVPNGSGVRGGIEPSGGCELSGKGGVGVAVAVIGQQALHRVHTERWRYRDLFLGVIAAMYSATLVVSYHSHHQSLAVVGVKRHVGESDWCWLVSEGESVELSIFYLKWLWLTVGFFNPYRIVVENCVGLAALQVLITFSVLEFY